LISRRTFLRCTGTLAASLRLEKLGLASGFIKPELDPSALPHYVEPLPLPEVVHPIDTHADPFSPTQKLPLYRVRMEECHLKVHRDLPPTRVWGFNGASPGPLFETRSSQGLMVEWQNRLPKQHFLPIDHTLCGAESDKPDVRCVIHLHGGRTPAASDGYPEQWVTPGNSILCHYPNRQDAALLFYHDHTMGINRLNIYAGLQGLFIVRDEHEEALDLPRGPYEIPLLLYDRFLLADGQLEYPTSGNPKSPWVPEVYSNVMLANGRLFPFLEVEPRTYRFRILNGSNTRFFRLAFGDMLAMKIIGSDQGLLAAPVEAKRILLAPAERTDVLFNFAPYAGKQIVLRSGSFDILQVRVAGGGASTTSSLPSRLRSIDALPESRAVKTRRLTLNEAKDKVQQSMGMTLNNTPWHMPVTERPVLNTTEIWEIVNLTEDTHPIHLHLVKFRLLDRRPFDVFDYLDKTELHFTGPAIPPAPEESGWKDTVRCEQGHVTRIIVPFEGFAGRYVWHCHILEHEDNEMMRPFEIVPAE
jgi:spore coat protein A, manganese oxidase